MERQPIIRMVNITKEFPGVKALTDINLEFYQGEVHALLGENGAGKSTLIKIMSGVYQKNTGTMYYEGKECDFENARQALDCGISVIHQELSVIPDLTVAENIYLGREQKQKNRFLDKEAMKKGAQEILDMLGLKIKPTDVVKKLSAAQKQMVEIARAISGNAKVVIMDEPTSSISEHEVEALFKIIEKLKRENVSIIYISHRLKELFEIADKVSILRDGHYIKTIPLSEVNEQKLISLMVGREIKTYIDRSDKKIGDPVLELQKVSRRGAFSKVDITVGSGEIVGMAGLIGAGRTEVLRGIFGAEPFDEGKMYLYGEEVHIKCPKQAIQKGIGLVPEDRRTQGVMLKKSVKDNITLSSVKGKAKHGFINKAWESKSSQNYINKLAIKTPGGYTITKNLSGGNQQKIVIAKWFLAESKILLLDEPTRGIDVGAKFEIYSLMKEFTQNGGSVLVVSSELPELLGICDRIYVMSEGKITGCLEQHESTEEVIMHLASVN
ncbi:MAG: sugar ABC transporter ATP-binding protein [Lachnospiraceae bacterium]|nr:sugar ABC transporter ATP-binding protein [Lachnospiraceae bacterium]